MKANHLLGDGFCPPSTAASHSKGPSTMRVFFGERHCYDDMIEFMLQRPLYDASSGEGLQSIT